MTESKLKNKVESGSQVVKENSPAHKKVVFDYVPPEEGQ